MRYRTVELKTENETKQDRREKRRIKKKIKKRERLGDEEAAPSRVPTNSTLLTVMITLWLSVPRIYIHRVALWMPAMRYYDTIAGNSIPIPSRLLAEKREDANVTPLSLQSWIQPPDGIDLNFPPTIRTRICINNY